MQTRPLVLSRRTLLGAAGVGIAAVAAGCGDSSRDTPAASGKPLVVQVIDSGTWQANFNPLSPSRNFGTVGLFYEPLFFFNLLKPNDITPMLGTKYTWSDDGKTLRVQVRDSVKWSDGQPFTVDDVVFTYQTILASPQLNTGGLDITRVATEGKDTVVFTFPATSYTKLWNVIGQVSIVPKHLLSGKDLTTETNPQPVGTGPFALTAFSSQLYTVKANPNYWNGKPKVPEVKFPAYTATAVQTGLQNGEIDWGSAFVPDLDKIYVRGDAGHNKHWFPPDGLVALMVNLTKPPFDNVAVRQAISLAIDRDRLVKSAERGYTQTAHPTGLRMPGEQDWVPEKYRTASYKVDTAKAQSLLAQAGYTADNKLAFELLVPTPYTDYVNGAQLMREDLAKVGIDATVRGVSVQDWASKASKGDFAATFAGFIEGPTPFYMYRTMLSGKLTAPIGQAAAANRGRWQNAATDQLLDQYANTNDKAAQTSAVQQLAATMVEQLPYIPLFGSPNWAEYRTTKYTGWPDQGNPYAMPSPSNSPDMAVVLTHLKPV